MYWNSPREDNIQKNTKFSYRSTFSTFVFDLVSVINQLPATVPGHFDPNHRGSRRVGPFSLQESHVASTRIVFRNGSLGKFISFFRY